MKDFVKKVSKKISKLSEAQLASLFEDLNSENDVLNSLVESLSTGLVIVDENYIIMQHNKAAERLIPFVSRQAYSEQLPVWQLVDDEPLSLFLKSCASEQKTNVSEEFSIASDGGIKFLSVTILPFVQKHWNESADVVETKIAGYIITVDDITQKRQQEILLHRMESLASLTNLAASVAHEIKNPLGAISIHIQLLQRAVKKAREGDGMLPVQKYMENYLDVVNEEIDNLNKIVLDFLFAVRPVQATMTLCSPDSLIEKFSSFFKPEFDAKNVSLELRLSKRNTRLLMDEKLFREVIVNIVQNALAAITQRFSSSAEDMTGGFSHGELIIESWVKDEHYFLSFADNGSGMDSETSSHIFEPYYTTKSNGTGLGLTTVYKIIKEFRGDIDVKSVLGHGTVFTITLPVPQSGVKLIASKKSAKDEK
ncbi:MAG: two-component sensor histidine kinase [Treponema sp.]|nr:two-component sensor histidine kinase [Treponema sp.]